MFRIGVNVALQAQGIIALSEQFLIHRTVGAMAGGAAFADGIMGEDERTKLGFMTLEAGFIFAAELGASALDGIA